MELFKGISKIDCFYGIFQGKTANGGDIKLSTVILNYFVLLRHLRAAWMG